jgi:hypothetical protein
MLTRHEVLVALGPGGTTELAERVLVLLESQTAPNPWPKRLGGLAEVCEELGATRQAVGHWIAGRRGPGNFPRPFLELSATPVWDLDAVASWSTEGAGEKL